MITNIYAIYDLKAKVFNQPFFLQNDDVAIRTCTSLANDTMTQCGQYPEDYVLYNLGQYDDSTGHMSSTQEEHTVITKLAALVTSQKQEFEAMRRNSLKNGGDMSHMDSPKQKQEA